MFDFRFIKDKLRGFRFHISTEIKFFFKSELTTHRRKSLNWQLCFLGLDEKMQLCDIGLKAFLDRNKHLT